MSKPRFTWMDGRITPWEESVVHVNTDAFLRGTNVFEGVRAYVSDDGSNLLVFRLEDHLQRLFGTSMRVLRLSLPYNERAVAAAVLETLRANEIREDTHIRIVAYFGEGKEASFLPEDISTGCFILTLPRPSHPAVHTGITACVSPWRRIADNSMPPRIKAGANYLNSRLATVDARLKGFELPILLNERGKVAEGPGQCIFLVRRGTVISPRTTDGILESITRETVLDLARQLGIPCEVREVDFTELYIADELFFAGTAAEVLPIVDVDHYVIGDGSVGSTTAQLQTAYVDVVRGVSPSPPGWVTQVYDHVVG